MADAFDPFPGLRPIGFWKGADQVDLPDPNELIDDGWDAEERSKLAELLASAATHQPGEGCSVCRICGAPNGFVNLSDGTFVWPEGLAHYVSEHAVRLPVEVVAGLFANAEENGVRAIDAE